MRLEMKRTKLSGMINVEKKNREISRKSDVDK